MFWPSSPSSETHLALDCRLPIVLRYHQNGCTSNSLRAMGIDNAPPVIRISTIFQRTSAFQSSGGIDGTNEGGHACFRTSKVRSVQSFHSVFRLTFPVSSWEQGTAAMAVLEADDSEYSIFADNPFRNHGRLPVATLRLSQSAVTRQGDDGRLSQTVGDGNDGSALDGAASGVVVLLGEQHMFVQTQTACSDR